MTYNFLEVGGELNPILALWRKHLHPIVTTLWPFSRSYFSSNIFFDSTKSSASRR